MLFDISIIPQTSEELFYFVTKRIPYLCGLWRFANDYNTLKAERSSREKFFYLFYRRANKENKIDLRRLAVILGTIAMQEAFNDN